MRNKLAPDDALLAVAEHNARDSEYLRSDLENIIFPYSNQMVSEEMLASIRADSHALLSGLGETILAGLAIDPVPPIGELMGRDNQRSLHHGGALLEFLYTRYHLCRLEKRLAAGSEVPLSQSLPARLLSDADHHVADCGQIILATSGMMRRSAPARWSELPADLLHQLSWRIVALLEAEYGDADGGAGSEKLRSNAQKLLTGYTENQRLPVAAQKFIHLAAERFAAEIQDVARSGLAIFIGALEQRLRLDAAHIAQLIGSGSLPVLAVLQRGAGIAKDQAMANICLLYGFDLTPYDITLFEEGYAALPSEDAKRTVTGWHIARMQRSAEPADMSGTKR